MSTERESLRALVGGRWAVSWQGFLLAWPWAILFTVYSTPTLWVPYSLAEGLARGVLFGTLTYFPVGVVFWLASVTVLRNRRKAPVSIYLVALVGSVAWTARTIALVGLLQFMDLSSEFSGASRLLSGVIQGAIAATITAWLFAKLTNFLEQRRALLADLVSVELAAERIQDSVEEMRNRVLDSVRETVDTTVKSLEDQLNEETASTQDVQALAHTTKRISQNLARELWEEASSTTRVNASTIINSAITNRPFAYWALLPIVVLGLIVLPILWSFTSTVITLSVVTAFALVISFATNALTPRLSSISGAFVYSFAIMLLLGTGILLEVTVRLLDLSLPSGNALPFLVAINFGVLYPLIGAGAHIGRAQQEILTQLQLSISDAEVNREALRREESHTRRDLAYALHGGLQADLTATAMRAQHAIDQGDSVLARKILDQAKVIIEASVELPRSKQIKLQAMADAVIQSWEGIVDVNLNLNVSLEPEPNSVAHIEAVLLEGIGNAVRHAHAKYITVMIDDHDGDLHVTVKDDGAGAHGGVIGSRAGLGSSMFEDIAPGTWSLTPTLSGGSTLTVVLRTATPRKTTPID